jgi:hypothetical protein
VGAAFIIADGMGTWLPVFAPNFKTACRFTGNVSGQIKIRLPATY